MIKIFGRDPTNLYCQLIGTQLLETIVQFSLLPITNSYQCQTAPKNFALEFQLIFDQCKDESVFYLFPFVEKVES